jgi:mutator protein MutT
VTRHLIGRAGFTHHVSRFTPQLFNGPVPVIDVAAALVFRDGKLLITQRYAKAHLGGLWEFPGGKREPDETFEQCLVRELREELGIEVAVGGLVESITHEYPEKTVHLKFFRCQWKQHEPQPLGCPDFRWVTAAELKEYAFPAADARLLEKLAGSPGLWRTDGVGS